MEYESGMDNRYRQELLVENEPVIFDVLDSSCNHSLTPANIDTNFCSTVDIVLLIYSIIDRGSFSYIRNLMRHFAQIKNNCNLSLMQLPLIAIVGNKGDLVHLRFVLISLFSFSFILSILSVSLSLSLLFPSASSILSPSFVGSLWSISKTNFLLPHFTITQTKHTLLVLGLPRMVCEYS